MCHPKNIYAVLAPMYYTTKILGLSPFRVDSRRFSKSRLNLLASICLMLCLNTYTGIGLDSRPGSYYSQRFIARVTDLAASYLTQMSMCFGILFSCIFVNKVLLSLQEIQQFDKDAQVKFGVNLAQEYRKSKLWLTWALGITSACIVFIVVCSAVPTMHTVTLQTVGEFLAYVVPEIINSFIEFQFCALIMCLKQRFSWLNNTVVIVCQNLNNKLLEYDDIFSTGEKEKPKRPTTHVVTTGLLQDKAMDTIEKIRLKHHDLCTICKRLNTAYSVQIVFIIVSTFISIIILMYFGGKRIFVDQKLPVDYLLYCAVQIALAIFQIVALVRICSKTSLEAKKTGILIHNAISLQQQHSCKEDLQMGISSFALQLLHQNVEFTACRMFPIDETLLVSMVGAITTYLVIVVQFEVAEFRNTHVTNSTL